jgi:ribA/ribD-fused uncharacterized protein
MLFKYKLITASRTYSSQDLEKRARMLAQKICIFLVSFDVHTKKHNVLLTRYSVFARKSHNLTDKWTEFVESTKAGYAPDSALFDLLEKSLHKALVPSATFDWKASSNYVQDKVTLQGCIKYYYYVPVQWQSSATILAQTQQNKASKYAEFCWVPLGDLLAKRYGSTGQIKAFDDVDPDTMMHISLSWPRILTRLTGKVPHNPTWYDIAGIRFYEKSGRYYAFTNFHIKKRKDKSIVALHIDQEWWPCVEIYFQTQRFKKNSKAYKIVSKLTSPKEAFDKSHELEADSAFAKDLNTNFAKEKVGLMLRALRVKFAVPSYRTALLATDNLVLIENSGKKDAFYGDGEYGQGSNVLGILLMHVRSEIRKGTQIVLDEKNLPTPKNILLSYLVQ